MEAQVSRTPNGRQDGGNVLRDDMTQENVVDADVKPRERHTARYI
jgi:hypothetical protein